MAFQVYDGAAVHELVDPKAYDAGARHDVQAIYGYDAGARHLVWERTPLDLSLAVLDHDSIRADWTGPSGGADEFVLKRGSTERYRGAASTFTDNGLQESTTYSYSLSAYRGGVLVDSDSASAKTQAQPITSKTWSGFATWSQSYQGNNTKRNDGNGNTYLYHGYSNYGWGHFKSLIGFAVPDEVHGCYAIDKITLKLYWEHAWYSSGCTIGLGTHRYTSEPTTWATSEVAENQKNYTGKKPGWVGSSAGIDITSWAKDNFISTAEGISIGPAPNTSLNYYGYGAGSTRPNRPWLEIKYRIKE